MFFLLGIVKDFNRATLEIIKITARSKLPWRILSVQGFKRMMIKTSWYFNLFVKQLFKFSFGLFQNLFPLRLQIFTGAVYVKI